jgi:hypothetical protein
VSILFPAKALSKAAEAQAFYLIARAAAFGPEFLIIDSTWIISHSLP